MHEHKLLEISNEVEFKDTLQSELPVLIDFWAPWCGPCQAMSPILSSVAEDYAGKVKIVKLNIDNLRSVASEYNIRGIPHCILFQDGVPLGSVTGLQSKSALVDFMKQHLSALQD